MAKEKDPFFDDDEDEEEDKPKPRRRQGFGISREEAIRRRDGIVDPPPVTVACDHSKDCWCGLPTLMRQYKERYARWERAHKRWQDAKTAPPKLKKDGTPMANRLLEEPKKPKRPTRAFTCYHRGPHRQIELCDEARCDNDPGKPVGCVVVKKE